MSLKHKYCSNHYARTQLGFSAGRWQNSVARKRLNGFTLIEVLIALLVLAIGLLGLAGLEMAALKNNQSAYYRGQATLLAYDIADRMRANVVNAQLFATSTYVTLAPTSASNQAGCLTVANACTAAQMAQQDLFEWNRDVTATLPMGQGVIVVNAPKYTITINWDDDRNGVRDTNDPNFTMSFQL